MDCKLCGSGATSVLGKDDYRRVFCHSCNGHEYKGLLINKRDWDKWVNWEVQELKGIPIETRQ